MAGVSRYHPLLVFLHWLLAAGISFSLARSFIQLAPMSNADPAKLGALRLHMTAGLVLLTLMSIRLVVRLTTVRPSAASTGTAMLDRLAVWTHYGFYFLIFAMAGTGLATAVLAGLFPIVYGGSGAPLPPSFQAFPTRNAHAVIAGTVVALLALHISAALFHQFVRNDGLFRRLWFGKRWPAIAVMFAICGTSVARADGIDYDKVDFTVRQLAPNFYTLTGSPGVDPGHPEAAGGRIGVLVGPDGVFMVDASYAPLTGKIMAAIRTLNAGPIRFLVNTHSHPDHTGGNANFAKFGATIIAREETWQTLNQVPPPALVAAIGRAASFTDPARLPIITYGAGESLKLRFDNETIDLIAMPAAHTDSDTIIRFETADVIMLGDFYRNFGYPFVDTTHGGSFAGSLAALDQVMKLAGPQTKLVPGHGGIITKADIPPYGDMILKVEAQVRSLIADGKSRPEVLAAKLTAPFDDQVPGSLTPLPAGFGNSADRFVGDLYDEVKRGS